MLDRLPVVPPPVGARLLSICRMRCFSSSVIRPPGVSSRLRAACAAAEGGVGACGERGQPHGRWGSKQMA